MAKEELVRTLDFILNRCNEQEIEAVAAAIIRRRREIAMFGSMPVAPDARSMAKELSSQLNIEGSIEGLKNSVRDFAIRTIKQEAPELTEDQIEQLTSAWIPDINKPEKESGNSIPQNVLASMIDQFVSFSMGRMDEEEDHALRGEMGAWPDKYWKAFPQVIRLLLSDYIKGEINENDFNTRLGLALRMG